ncbi:hypothetical protein GOP47_0018020 [Adiantum capillus-veneris]|uniref:Uncharacterized protein n=1 Tax=Adiantum capillus-veneris TaxID=13818 RepID=A0A9D4ZB81_ADICA|nr:hypothetical protein GOP47_0018020 [Adiantum capillus-veneris]
MAQPDAHAKPLCSSQPVGLLAILADTASVALSNFGQQKLFRHVSYGQTYHPNVCLSQALPDNLETKHSASSRSALMPCPEKKSCISEKKGQRRTVKKVRFALDVVEPTGDSREYRDRKDVEKGIHRKAYEERQEHNEMEGDVEEVNDASSPPAVVSSCEDHNCRKQVKPTLPVNRMLLYKGMQCYKSKMMPCW